MTLILQGKFPTQSSSNPPHGISLPTTPIIALNALGAVGFKVVSTCAQHEDILWTLSRNLDVDIQENSSYQESRRDSSEGKKKELGRRRNSLAPRMKFLQL